MLTNVYQRALRNGGQAMPAKLYPKLFGNNPALRKNVLRACANEAFGQAIKDKVVTDHRVFEHLTRLGERAARIVLELERRRGSKLTRARAHALVTSFSKINRPVEYVPIPASGTCLLCSGSGQLSPTQRCVCTY